MFAIFIYLRAAALFSLIFICCFAFRRLPAPPSPYAIFLLRLMFVYAIFADFPAYFACQRPSFFFFLFAIYFIFRFTILIFAFDRRHFSLPLSIVLKA